MAMYNVTSVPRGSWLISTSFYYIKPKVAWLPLPFCVSKGNHVLGLHHLNQFGEGVWSVPFANTPWICWTDLRAAVASHTPRKSNVPSDKSCHNNNNSTARVASHCLQLSGNETTSSVVELVVMAFPPSPFVAKRSHTAWMSGESSAKSLSHSQHLSS